MKIRSVIIGGLFFLLMVLWIVVMLRLMASGERMKWEPKNYGTSKARPVKLQDALLKSRSMVEIKILKDD